METRLDADGSCGASPLRPPSMTHRGSNRGAPARAKVSTKSHKHFSCSDGRPGASRARKHHRRLRRNIPTSTLETGRNPSSSFPKTKANFEKFLSAGAFYTEPMQRLRDNRSQKVNLKTSQSHSGLYLRTPRPKLQAGTKVRFKQSQIQLQRTVETLEFGPLRPRS